MLNLLLLAVIQAAFLCAGQVLLKIAMQVMPPFSWTGEYFLALLTNWWLLGCGICFTIAGVMWLYILRHYPFSQAYPLSSMAYVFGMIAALLLFHEHIAITGWLGILLIMAGCWLVVQ